MNTETVDTKKQLAKKVKSIKDITTTSGRKAEEAFMAIAHVEGDKAAMAVLTELNPEELGKILKDHDATIPSIAAWLAEPEQIAQLFAKSPADWKDVTKENIIEIQENVLSLLASVILTSKEERQAEILEAIKEIPAAIFYLCLPFIGQKIDLEDVNGGYIELVASDITMDDFHKSHGTKAHLETLMELLTVIKNLDRELLKEMRDFIKNQTTDNPWNDILKTVILLREEASEKKKKTKQSKKNYAKMFP